MGSSLSSSSRVVVVVDVVVVVVCCSVLCGFAINKKFVFSSAGDFFTQKCLLLAKKFSLSLRSRAQI